METINAIGRRKASVVRVFLKKGKGEIKVNGKDYTDYFTLKHLIDSIVEPLNKVDVRNDFDLQVNASGGGVKGQAEACRLAIARALVKVNAEYKPVLKAANFMTRDARIVERKKPGLKKARKATQYRKR